MRLTILLAMAAVAAALATGCASNAASRQPALARAEASIQDAERAGAYEDAAAQLRLAREELGQAQDALNDGDETLAARLATKAELDADLASAMTSNRQAQAALSELDDTIATLRQETRRQSPSAGPVGR